MGGGGVQNSVRCHRFSWQPPPPPPNLPFGNFFFFFFFFLGGGGGSCHKFRWQPPPPPSSLWNFSCQQDGCMPPPPPPPEKSYRPAKSVTISISLSQERIHGVTANPLLHLSSPWKVWKPSKTTKSISEWKRYTLTDWHVWEIKRDWSLFNNFCRTLTKGSNSWKWHFS